MTRNVLKRDDALRPLSRDHGVLLVLAQKLQKAAGAGAECCARLHKEIQTELAPLTKSYLSDEDSALSRIGISKVLCDKVKRDHAEINRSLEQMPAPTNHVQLRKHFDSLAGFIENHIRWDEHVLFPYIQETADSNTFSAVDRYTQTLESKRRRPTQQLHQSIALHRNTRGYLCQACDNIFTSGDAKPPCPKCRVKFAGNIVPIYVEHEREKEQMYSAVDWIAGD